MKEHLGTKVIFSFWVIVLFWAVVFWGRNSASSFAAEPELPENPTIGSEVFIRKGCMNCHTILGEGGTVGPDLGNTKLHLSFMDLAGIMWNHSPQMERKFREEKFRRPRLNSEEMQNLIAFLYYLDYFDKPGDPVEGEKLFQEKKCSTCHSLGGKGGMMVPTPPQPPRLDRFKQYVSPIFFTTALWNAMKNMTQAMRMHHHQDMDQPVFRENDVANILSYINAAGIVKEEYSRVYITPGNPNTGRALLVQKGCVQCHTTGRSGESGKISLRAQDLRGSLTQIAGTIWKHGPKMWAKMAELEIPTPKFTVEEMSDLIAYLYFLQHVDEPGDPLRGKKLFQEQEKGCHKCHPIRGVGGDKKIAPDLATEKNLDTPVDIIRAMWNHGSEMEEKMQEKGVTWPKMEKGEMMDLVEFIRSQRAE
jgi:mono/diheme cytochrome c family protein